MSDLSEVTRAYLSDQQNLSIMKEKGYAIIPQVISKPAITKLKNEIDNENIEYKPNAGFWKKGISKNTKAWSYFNRIGKELKHALNWTDSAFGPMKSVVAVKGFQKDEVYILPPHVDGKGEPEQGFEIYDAVVGICLTDAKASNAGNLVVWPGSHKRI